MAEASISVAEDQFSCSICLDLLKDPVTIPCGHSYSMSCITDYWDQDDQKGIYSCPQCRQTFTPRPALYKNVVLAEMVEKLQKTSLQHSVSAPSYAGAGDVGCDACSGRKQKAVKSCLVCLESYCQSHFERHEEFHSCKRHTVTDVTGNLQEMICSKHDKLLDVFCHTDQQCICVLCTMDKHKHHVTVSAVSERIEKQKELCQIQRKFKQKIQDRENELQELTKHVDSYKRSAQAMVEDSERIFTQIIRSIQRSRSEVTQLIRDQEKSALSLAKRLLRRLEQEIAALRRRDADLEQLLNTDNHIHFLQNFQSFSTPPASTDFTAGSLLSFDDIKVSVCQLREKLENICKEEIKKISGKVTEISKKIVLTTREDFLQYSSHLTIDPNTVFESIRLSEGNRRASNTAPIPMRTYHPNRFRNLYQVLCREKVCGRCYWEVQRSGAVGISVSYKSTSRKGKGVACGFGYNEQSWSLHCSSSRCSLWHNNKKTELPVASLSSRIGVYVDHSAGTLSFYSVSDTMTLIHRVQTAFTQPLYPGFWLNNGSTVQLNDHNLNTI